MTDLIDPRLITRSMNQSSMARHMRLGLAAIACLLAGLGIGAWANIGGAVIAHGLVAVSSDTKKIQHPAGGVVREILVRNGSVVSGGDVLLILDETVNGANLAMVNKNLTELRLRKARLLAERDGAGQIVFPPQEELAPEIADNAQNGERALFETRRGVNGSVKAQLRQRIQQTQDELVGLRGQLDAKVREIGLVATELKGAGELWSKNLIPISKYTALQREAVRLDGERGQLLANIALAKGKITETELRILQIDQDLSSDVGKELRETEYRINELVERKVAAEDQLRRTRILAPQAGIVHELAVHTVGGVIGPRDTIMLLVPQDEPLVAEVRIPPQDIDHVHADQEARLRFSAFDRSTTPDCEGKVTYVSADFSTDSRSGAAFYLARIEMKRQPESELGSLKLLPGMPVDAFIRTEDRSILSYLTKSMADQLRRALRDG